MSLPKRCPEKNNTDPSINYGPAQKPWKSQVPPFAEDKISPPSADPVHAYYNCNKGQPFDTPYESLEVPTQYLELPPSGITSRQKRAADRIVKKYVARQQAAFLGYQVEERIDYSHLSSYLEVCLNNIGDPFINGYYTVNSKINERMVLDYYASLWNANWPSRGASIKEGRFDPGDPESYWGYVLTMGSTEGNLYGMLNARDYLSGRMLLEEQIEYQREDGEIERKHRLFSHQPEPPEDNPNAFTPVAFFSQDTHYSIVKAMEVEKILTFSQLGRERYPDECPLGGDWPEEVPSMPPSEGFPCGTGAIDVDKLMPLVEFFAEKGYPILLCLNYGTTFKGAYDDIPEVCRRLEPVLKEYGLWERKVEAKPVPEGKTPICHMRTGYWIHVDGALGASYMPFVKMAKGIKKYAKFFEQIQGYTGPEFDFKLPMVHSIVTSGHKFPGAPWPTGLYMTRQKYLVLPPDNPEYIGSPDTTFAGSRNGFSALILWDYLARTPYAKQVELAMKAQQNALYAYKKLSDVARKIAKRHDGYDIRLQHTPLALSLIFQKPSDEIVFRYSLCGETVQNPHGDDEWNYVHFFVMWDVDKSLIDRMAADLLKPGAFPEAERPKAKVVSRTVTRALPAMGNVRPLINARGGYR